MRCDVDSGGPHALFCLDSTVGALDRSWLTGNEGSSVGGREVARALAVGRRCERRDFARFPIEDRQRDLIETSESKMRAATPQGDEEWMTLCPHSELRQ